MLELVEGKIAFSNCIGLSANPIKVLTFIGQNKVNRKKY